MSAWLQCVLSRLLGPRSGHPVVVRVAFALLLAILLAWAGDFWLHTLRRVIRDYNPLPVYDYWRVPEQLQNYQRFNLRALWRQHNEHRILFPELFFGADMLWFHGKQFLPIVANFATYIGCWILLVIALNSDRQVSRSTRRFAAVLAAIVIGWPGIGYVLSTPFLLQWTLMQFATCLSFVFLWRHKATSCKLHLWIASLAAFVATYSSGNALLLWPLLIGTGILLQLPRRSLIALAISGLFSILLYFIGYQMKGTLHLAALLRHPIYTFEFLCAYLSMPLVPARSVAFTVGVGSLYIAFTCCFFWLAKRYDVLRSSLAVLFFGFFALLLLTGLLTAAGRMDPVDKSFSAAKQARYLTMPLLNWSFFAAAALWIADRIRSKMLQAVSTGLIVAFFALLLSNQVTDWARSHDKVKADEQLATLDVENGVTDLKLTKKIFPNTAYISRFAPLLQKNRLSIYYNGPAEWLGTPITAFMNDLGPTQEGEVTFTFPVQGGIELAGTAGVPPHTRLTDPQIVFANFKGEIVGFGRRIRAGVPHQLANSWPPAPLQWVAFINFSFDTHEIRPYLVSGARLFPLDMRIPDNLRGITGSALTSQFDLPSMDGSRRAASTPLP